MSIYAIVLSKCSQRKYLTHFFNNRVYVKSVLKRKFSFMSANQQTKSFVFVNIPENGNVANSRRNIFTSFFRRNRNATKVQKNAETAAGGGVRKAELVRLFSLAKPEKWKLFGGLLFLIVSSTVTMAIPFSLGKVLDIIYNSTGDVEEAKTRLNRVGLILLGVFVLAAICNFGRVFFMSIAGYRMTQALRRKVFNSIMRQDQTWFDQRPTGELINRLSADTQLVGQALSSNISDGLRSLVMVTAGTGMMFYMSYELALVGLAIVPPLAGVAVVYGRFVRNISRKVQDSLAEATKVAEERIGNIRTVKTFAQETREMDSYGNSIKTVLDLAYREVKARSAFFGLVSFSGHIIIISVLYYGGVMVSSHTITVGNLSSFLLYAAYIGISVSGLSSFYAELNKSLGAASRIWEIIDREPLIPIEGGLVPLASPNGHIHFKDITFSYPTRSDTPIFSDLQLEITPGLTLAVVGPSGAGKSTLAALLLRLYDPQEGGVFVDGCDVKDLDPVWLKKHIGTVSQEPVLFSCSIKDNILYGAENPDKITEEELMQVAKEANVYEFARQMPEGFDTMVGERGVMLSGGQKQRVAIARALIKNPKILLLDEATSALDAHSEHLVQEAMERIMKGRTVLTIAHRLSTIQNADVIAVLKDGKIVEQGKYQELMCREGGAFRELIKHQTFHEVEQT